MSDDTGRRLIFSIVFLATLSGVVVLMSDNLTDINPSEYRQVSIPDSLYGAEFFKTNVTIYWNGTINDVGQVPYELLPAPAQELIIVEWNSYMPSQILLSHKFNQQWWGFQGYEAIKPYPITTYVIENEYDEGTNSSQFYMNSKSYSWLVTFSYNQTAYDNITASWEDGELYLYIGRSPAQVAQDQNAWSLISSVLFWNNPDIHPAINFLIAIPIYATTLVIFFFLFTRFLEAVKPL